MGVSIPLGPFLNTLSQIAVSSVYLNISSTGRVFPPTELSSLFLNGDSFINLTFFSKKFHGFCRHFIEFPRVQSSRKNAKEKKYRKAKM